MTDFTIASFNVKNLIGPDQEYYRFQRYTPEEYAWKLDWIAEQVQTLNADIICFQEIFEESALRDVIDQANREGAAGNESHIPGPDKRYRRKAIFSKLAYQSYGPESLAVAPNVADGAPGSRRPGLAILSRFGFAEPPVALQDLPEPVEVPLGGLVPEDGGTFRLLTQAGRGGCAPGRAFSLWDCTYVGASDRPPHLSTCPSHT